MTFGLAVITNARSADQRSMIGYGELVLSAARQCGASVVEFAGVSTLSSRLPTRAKGGRISKAVGDVERFILSPMALAGGRADIVHVVDPGNIIYLDVLRYRRSVVTVHDMIPYLCLAGKLEGFQPSARGRLLMREIIKRLKKVNRIVCVSEATRRDLVQMAGVERSQTVVIPNAIFQPMAPASKEECQTLRAELDVPANAPLLLHVGGSFYKNHAAVLEVFARVRDRLPEAHLVFLVPRAHKLAEAVAAHGFEDCVRFVRFLPSARMAALYTAANLLIFPSLYEGFGYPVLEAQLCGTPVICANSGSLPEVAGDGALLFAPDDVNGMAEATVRILTDPAASGRMVALGKENARRFSHDAWIGAHKSLYGELWAAFRD